MIAFFLILYTACCIRYYTTVRWAHAKIERRHAHSLVSVIRSVTDFSVHLFQNIEFVSCCFKFQIFSFLLFFFFVDEGGRLLLWLIAFDLFSPPLTESLISLEGNKINETPTKTMEHREPQRNFIFALHLWGEKKVERWEWRGTKKKINRMCEASSCSLTCVFDIDRHDTSRNEPFPTGSPLLIFPLELYYSFPSFVHTQSDLRTETKINQCYTMHNNVPVYMYIYTWTKFLFSFV